MNLYFPPFIYSYFLVSGTLISISSSSLFGMWMGLEINLMAFIPAIINLEESKKSNEAAIKYFLIQAIASSIIIMSSLLFFLFTGIIFSNLPKMFMTLALCTKLGMPPFHFWFPEVLEGLSWMNSLLLLTWQKIAPLIILSFFFFPIILLTLSIMSALLGAILGLNQTSLRKIMAYSSIAHLGWMSGIMYMNSSVWLDYFIIYSITNFIVCISFWFLSVNLFSQLLLMQGITKKMIIFINLLSLGGLPPLLGFFPKWIAMLILKEKLPLLLVLIFSSLVTLFFYTRMCFSTFTLSSQDFLLNINKNHKKFKILSLLTMSSLLGIIPTMILFF
uniref:NADH dehydrogenase subunit 2 n=1 Tax=Calantica studeri TaxID=2977347 RepID=UPI0021CC5328|nr:NADH dehydrogenase subunit 2 [Calantica studeri]UWM12856.1 NADH dehydrogenase subunit 2 [Calantica studeri]